MAGTSDVHKLLVQVGADMGRSEDQMKPFIQKLEDQWLDSIDALAELKDDQWEKLGLPMRLADKLKEAVKDNGDSAGGMPDLIPTEQNGTANGDTWATPRNHASSSASTAKRQKPEECTEYDTVPPIGWSAPKVSIAALVQQVEQDVQNTEGRMVIWTTILKMIGAILETPGESKKRIINFSNEKFQERLGQYSSAMKVMEAAGFKDVNGMLKMEMAYLSTLRETYNTVAQAVANMGGRPAPCPGFNPYGASFSAVSGAVATKPTGSNADKRFQEQEIVRKQLEEKQKAVEMPAYQDVPLNATAFWHQSLGSLKDAIEVLADDSMDAEADATLFREALSQMKNAIGEGGKFKSRAKEELQTVSKKSVPKICILRVNFPNKQVLQVQFHPTETLQQVRDKIAPCLAPAYQGLNWYLYITPPLQRLTNFKSTLYKEGLCPGSSVYFGVEGVATAELSPPYMHPQLLANLPAEPPVTHVPERSLAEVQDMRMRQQEAALARANALAGNEGKPLPKF